MVDLFKRFRRGARGQALVETALVLPLLLALVLNTINFAYFFIIAINLAGSTRSGALYSIMGGSTPASAQSSFPGLPPASSTNCPAAYPSCGVSDITYADMTGGIPSPTTNGSVLVCSATVGVAGSGISQASACTSSGTNPLGYSFPSAAAPDPELNTSGTAPMFFLNRVDVAYNFTPLIPGTPFNIILLASPVCTSSGGVTCTFHRQVSMREMN